MRRVCFVVLVFVPLVLVPFTASTAKPGGDGSNKGGSDRSYEVRQNEENGGGNGNSGGTGTPDAGDNMHPSGNDKSVEPGGSYPQGQAQSDPDGMSNGGADKPGGSGGDDLADQDGNNGCGNDDDFEDDNNGKCLGQKKKAESDAAVLEAFVIGPALAGAPFNALGRSAQVLAVAEPVQVAAAAVEPPPTEQGTAVLAAAAQDEARVLGVSERAGTGALATTDGLLPTTGAGIASMIAIGLALVGAGLAARRWTRSRQSI